MQAFRHLARLVKGRVPGQLVIQMTDRCNALCPQCGMRASNPFRRTTLSTDRMKRAIDAAARFGVEAVSFTGGEPLLCLDELIELIGHAGRAGIGYIRTGTNGFPFRDRGRGGFHARVNEIAERLAATPLRNFWISVDSCDPVVHDRMRGFDGVIGGIERALPLFHRRGLYPSVNLGINRNMGGELTAGVTRAAYPGDSAYIERFTDAYREAFRRYYSFAVELGFTIANACYPMSIDDEEESADLNAVYKASSADDVVRFDREEKAALFRVLLETIPEFRGKIRIFSPRSSLHALVRQYSGAPEEAFPCRGGVDFFYLDSRDGCVYPCGYRGNENMGRFEELPFRGLKLKTGCRRCDWECFRDPSELFGPLVHFRAAPLKSLGRMAGGGAFARLWREDLRYYRACSYFDGRRPPEPERMGRFAAPPSSARRPLPHDVLPHGEDALLHDEDVRVREPRVVPAAEDERLERVL